jgi:hypothetical protein
VGVVRCALHGAAGACRRDDRHGDRRYLDLANRLWWKTTDYLYDKTEHLYFRDSRFFDQREPNGKKVFWSRGNGWVFAGMARLMNELPADHPDRARYVTLFREMAEKILAFRVRMVTGEQACSTRIAARSGDQWDRVLCFRPRVGYQPRSARSGALRTCCHARLVCDGQGRTSDGMLGWVQRIGDQPGATTANTTEVYGVGALLLAGSEVYRLAT